MEIKLNLSKAELMVLFQAVCEYKWRSEDELKSMLRHDFTHDPKGSELVAIAKDKIFKSEVFIHQINKSLNNL